MISLIRASADEIHTVFTLTRELMKYHNALDIFTLTEKRLAELIKNEVIHSYVALVDGKPMGVMNFFWKYTTFTGRKILYIEDLYVRSETRKSGVGRALIEKAKELAKANDCEQIELKCSDWNTTSAQFYEHIGFKAEKQWITYTMDRKLF